MPVSQNDVKSVFDQALEIASSDDRQAWLDRRCADDADLRDEVAKLLRAYEDAGSFLKNPMPDTLIYESPPDQVGTVIGPYKLREQIGEGGMGLVYVAEQTEPVRRKVALKLIKPGLDSADVLNRFGAERQALALMDHPNIARVFDAGTTDNGRPYFVMELVRGKPITEYCDEQRMTTRQRLDLFTAVCRAVQHAHQKGVIHRDIKPSNVLVTVTDGMPVPKVIDFGLAKAMHHSLSDGTVYTRFAQFLGTPAYMSPEQAEMTSHDIDTRSDVYSLGVLLYELLTGNTPFDKTSLKAVGFDEMRRMIREVEPLRPSVRFSTLNDEDSSTVSGCRGADPRQFRRQINGELDWVVMKALEKNRNRRYESSSALADDIERHLTDEPVEACPPSTLYRFRKFATRNKGLIGTLISVSTALLVGTGVALWQAGIAFRALGVADDRLKKMRQHESLAQDARREAARKSNFASQLNYADDIRMVANARRFGDMRRFASLLDRHKPKNGMRELRGFEWWYLHQLTKGRSDVTSTGTIGINVSKVSADGRYVIAGLMDGKVSIHNGRTKQRIASIAAHKGAIHDLDIAPDAKRYATVGEDGFIRIWNIEARQPIRTIRLDDDTGMGVRFALRGTVLVSFGLGTRITLWDSATGKRLRQLDGHAYAIRCFDVSPNGRFCVAGDSHGAIIWDLENPSNSDPPQLLAKPNCSCLRFSNDGRFIGGATVDNRVCVWDASTGRRLARFAGHKLAVQDVAFHPQRKLLASCDAGGIVRMWPIDHLTITRRYELGAECIWCEYVNDGRICIKTNDSVLIMQPETDHTARVPLSATPGLLNPPTRFVSFSHDGNRMLCRDELYSIEENDPRRWRLLFKLPRKGKAPWSSALSPDGRTAVTGDESGVLRFWKIRNDRALPASERNSRVRISTLRFSNDGTRLAAGYRDGRITIWDAKNQSLLCELSQHSREIQQLSFSPDGSRLASASLDFTVCLWSVKRSEIISVLKHGDRVGTVAFSPDGEILASHSYIPENLLRFWDGRNGRLLETHSPNKVDPERLSFSPNGRYLAMCGPPDTKLTIMRVPDTLRKSQWPSSAHMHNSLVSSIQWSPDGGQLITAGHDGTIRSRTAMANRPRRFRLPGVDGFRVIGIPLDGTSLFVAGEKNIRNWNVNSVTSRKWGSIYRSQVKWMAHSDTRHRIVTGHNDGTVTIWDRTQKPVNEFRAHKSGIWTISLSKDGNLLATTCGNRHPKLWNTTTGRLLLVLDLAQTCRDVSLSPDGRWLACTSGNNVVIYDTTTGRRRALLTGHQKTIECLTFSHSGQRLATGSHDRTIRIWDVQTWKKTHEVRGHQFGLWSVAFSQDDRTIAGGDVSGMLSLSHAATGRFLFDMKIADNTIRQLRFSADDTTLAATVNPSRLEPGGVVLIRAPREVD